MEQESRAGCILHGCGVLAALAGLCAASGAACFFALTPLSLIHISEPTRLGMISYAVFCLKKKNLSLIHISELTRRTPI